MKGELRRNPAPTPSTGTHMGHFDCPSCAARVGLRAFVTLDERTSEKFFQLVPSHDYSEADVDALVAAKASREPIPGMPTDAPRGKRFKDDPVPRFDGTDEPEQKQGALL